MQEIIKKANKIAYTHLARKAKEGRECGCLYHAEQVRRIENWVAGMFTIDNSKKGGEIEITPHHEGGPKRSGST